jgi:ribosome-binding protein aMBF1 (putative translation factor)
MSGDVPRPPGAGQDPPARHLVLVRPVPQPSPKRRKYQRAPTFTRDEGDRVRAALRRARTLYGSWAHVASLLSMSLSRVRHAAAGDKEVSGDLAVRLARMLGVSVESLYRAPTAASTCATCGRRS